MRDLGAWTPTGREPGRGAVHARAGGAAGLHRRALRGGPGRDARRDGPDEGRPRPDQPGGALRPGDRPLGPGRLVRLGAVAPAQRRARVRAEPSSATSCSSSPSGPSTTSGWCRRAPASSTRSTWSTWRRWCSSGRSSASSTAYPDTLVGTDSHTTMINGLGVRRLGRRRDRGRGGDAGPALLHADPRGRSA